MIIGLIVWFFIACRVSFKIAISIFHFQKFFGHNFVAQKYYSLASNTLQRLQCFTISEIIKCFLALSLACSKQSLPTYANAVAQDNLAVTYPPSSMVTYTCSSGFATTSNSLTCTCTAGDTAASWECNPTTDSDPAPCQPGEYSHPVGFCYIQIKKWCFRNTIMAKIKSCSAKHTY